MDRVIHKLKTVLREAIYAAFSILVRNLIGRRSTAFFWRLPKAESIYFRLASLRPEYVDLDGNRFYLDKTDCLHLTKKPYEEAELRFFRSLLEPGDNVVDIGAHIGYYALQAADLIAISGGQDGLKPAGIVFAFEPSPVNLAILRQNVSFNEKRNVEIFEEAVSDQLGLETLFLAPENSGDNRISAADRSQFEAEQAVEVKTTTLDHCLHQNGAYPDIKVIKMDIQGAERLALRGMHGLIHDPSNDELVIFTEVSREHHGNQLIKYLENLTDLGFSLYEIRENGLQRNDPQLIDLGIKANDVNIAAVRGVRMHAWADQHVAGSSGSARELKIGQ